MTRRTLPDKRILLTGASSGIGRALAIELARQRAKLVITARREDRLQTLAAEIVQLGGRVETVVGDIVEPDVRQRAVDRACEAFGGLDILVNNAGIGAMGLFENSSAETLRRVMEVNFFALVEMTRLALPLLVAGRQPMVVNVSSILGRRGVPHNTEYCASKFAVHGFSESLRTEVARRGIDVLVVSPGTTQTEFFDRVITKSSEPSWPEHAPVTAESVAREIVGAMRRGSREIVPYRWGRLLCLMQRVSPWLVDRIMARYV
jgi:short-subunit dehydrogenase